MLEKLKAFWEQMLNFIGTPQFIVGLCLGFALGALHHFYGL